ncbi:hypothetical protein ABK040_012755 [Willaertia magna]
MSSNNLQVLNNSHNLTTSASSEGDDEQQQTQIQLNISKYFNFSRMIQDKEAKALFTSFLAKKQRQEGILFIDQVLFFHSLNNIIERIDCLNKIKQEFITLGGAHELNLPKNIRKITLENIDNYIISLANDQSLINNTNCDNDIFKPIVTEIKHQLQTESFSEFKNSDEFEQFVLTKVIEFSSKSNPTSTSNTTTNSTTSLSNEGKLQSSKSFFSRLFRRQKSDSETVFKQLSKSSSTLPSSSTLSSKIDKKVEEDDGYDSDDEEEDKKKINDNTGKSISITSSKRDISFIEQVAMRRWSAQQTADFFEYKLELPQYVPIILKQDIKGFDLRVLKREMNDDDDDQQLIGESEKQKKMEQLFKRLKMVKLGHKKKLQRVINNEVLQKYYNKQYIQRETNKALESVQKSKSWSATHVMNLGKRNSTKILLMDRVIIKLCDETTLEKRLFTVKKGVSLTQLRQKILKEMFCISKEEAIVAPFTRTIQTAQGNFIKTDEDLHHYLLITPPHQFATLRLTRD